MEWFDQLTLMMTRGLPAEAARQLVMDPAAGEFSACGFLAMPAMERQHRLLGLRARGWLRDAGRVRWPSAGEVHRLDALLGRVGARLAWRGGPGYCPRLANVMGDAAPPWHWTLGPLEPFGRLSCAIIGSRRTPPFLLQAARRLARELSRADVTVVSGGADGADQAAHAGALEGSGGTILAPARGFLRANIRPNERLACIGLDGPVDSFSAGLAIRRNRVIAALADGLVLVAGGLKGGSSHAVRWAMEFGLPLWCFEAGPETPPANRHLLNRGLARPLALGDSPVEWAMEVRSALDRRGGGLGQMASIRARQADLFSEDPSRRDSSGRATPTGAGHAIRPHGAVASDATNSWMTGISW